MLTLNRFENVQYFAMRDLKIHGIEFEKGEELPDARGYKNLEALVRSRRIVPVVADRNAYPKMFYRELRSVAFVTKKYGFTPTLSGGTVAYVPGDHTVPEVLAYAAAHLGELAAIRAAEVAGLNRSTAITGLDALD